MNSFRESIGMLGSFIVLVSMCFKTDTIKGVILMRIFNFIGSIIFIYYGYMIDGWSVILLNGILAFVNIYYIISISGKNNTDKKLNTD